MNEFNPIEEIGRCGKKLKIRASAVSVSDIPATTRFSRIYDIELPIIFNAFLLPYFSGMPINSLLIIGRAGDDGINRAGGQIPQHLYRIPDI